jgi:hypothetical protein
VDQHRVGCGLILVKWFHLCKVTCHGISLRQYVTQVLLAPRRARIGHSEQATLCQLPGWDVWSVVLVKHHAERGQARRKRESIILGNITITGWVDRHTER